jgi:hypothetical protein
MTPAVCSVLVSSSACRGAEHIVRGSLQNVNCATAQEGIDVSFRANGASFRVVDRRPLGRVPSLDMRIANHANPW